MAAPLPGSLEKPPLVTTPDSAPEGYFQHVPLFADVLKVVAGRVPLIVEYKFDDNSKWGSRDVELMEKGDALLREYAQTLIEYIEHYLRCEGAQGDMVSGIIDEKLDQLGDVYYLASYAGRREVLAELNTYYRSLGVSEENLIDAGDKPQQPDSARLKSGIYRWWKVIRTETRLRLHPYKTKIK